MISFVLRLAVVAALLFPPAAPAFAELGGPLSSITADRGRMGAQLTSHALGRYSRHDLTRPNGGMVHELTNAQGQVFAVTWSGPGKPDLRSLLGRYFATYQGATGSIGRTMHALRRPALVADPDLQIQAEGHMGWFRGVAFVPSLAPAGFTPADLPNDR